MSKIDIRLLYQKERDESLDAITRIAEHNPKEVQAYIDWLEETLEAALSVGTQLFISHDILLGNEES